MKSNLNEEPEEPIGDKLNTIQKENKVLEKKLRSLEKEKELDMKKNKRLKEKKLNSVGKIKQYIGIIKMKDPFIHKARVSVIQMFIV